MLSATGVPLSLQCRQVLGGVRRAVDALPRLDALSRQRVASRVQHHRAAASIVTRGVVSGRDRRDRACRRRRSPPRGDAYSGPSRRRWKLLLPAPSATAIQERCARPGGQASRRRRPCQSESWRPRAVTSMSHLVGTESRLLSAGWRSGHVF